MPAAADNPDGFFENHSIEFFNASLLKRFGMRWDRVDQLPADWLETLAQERTIEKAIDLLDEEFGKQSNWVIKDPRMALLFDFWQLVFDRMGREISCVCTLRHPEEVVTSLIKRNGTDPAWAAQLYKIYNLAAETAGSKAKRTLWVSYEQFHTNPDKLVAQIGDFLGATEQLDVPLFYNALYHNRRNAAGVTQLGQHYVELVEGNDPPLNNEKLVAWLEYLRTRNYNDLVEFAILNPKAAQELEKTASTILTEKVERLGKELEQKTKVVAKKDLQNNELQERLANNAQMLGEARKQNKLLKAKVKEAKTDLKKATRRLSGSTQQLTQYKHQIDHLQATVSEHEKAAFGERKRKEKAEEQLAVASARQNAPVREVNQLNERFHADEQKLAELESSKAALRCMLAAKDQEISGLQSANSELQSKMAAMEASRETPTLRRLASFDGMTSIIRHGGGPVSTLKKGLLVLRRGGINGVKNRIRFVLETPAPASEQAPDAQVDLSGHVERQSAPVAATPFVKSEQDTPVQVSIIIPVYNQLEYTLKCLNSLQAIERPFPCEIIVMDDGSSDDTQDTLASFDHIRYIRNEKNLGFLRNCNKGASLARGRYLVFLNNDTELHPNWLTELHGTFTDHDDVGLVGSKLVYPDGRLQEAGGIIWEDGSGWNWGRLEDPDHPRYNFVRDVDYVSGASIMVERELFERLGRFDEHYEMAYYEDTDLAMRVRAQGLRVIYQPKSLVVHYEGISSGTDTSTGVKSYQVSNGKLFFKKWKEELKGNLPNAQTPLLASDRRPKGNILIIDETTPTPDQDSGSIDMFNLIKILLKLGYRVHFIPRSNFAHFGSYTDTLQKMGVECIYAPFYKSVDEFLEERGDVFSHVFLTRVTVAKNHINDVKTHCPSAKRIFYTVDLHHLRELREAELKNSSTMRALARQTEKAELAIMKQVDTTIVLSEAEQQMLEARGIKNLVTLPLIRDVGEPDPAPFSDRDKVVFIGGFQHAPNVDAADWLVEEIWPSVTALCKEKKIEPINLTIVGSKMPDRYRRLDSQNIIGVGFVPNLGELLSKTRLTIAPLRYGAGLKGKVATSLEYGVPVVGSPMAFEGMPREGLPNIALQADNAAELAAMIVNVYSNEKEWKKASKCGNEYVTQHYSSKALKPVVEYIVG